MKQALPGAASMQDTWRSLFESGGWRSTSIRPMCAIWIGSTPPKGVIEDPGDSDASAFPLVATTTIAATIASVLAMRRRVKPLRDTRRGVLTVAVVMSQSVGVNGPCGDRGYPSASRGFLRMSRESVRYRCSSELGDEGIGVEALERERLDQLGRLAGRDELGERRPDDRCRLEAVR